MRWSQRFPENSKPRILALLEKYAKLWGFEDWEIEVSLWRSRAGVAEILPIASSRTAYLKLRRDRLSEDVLERDLAHELLHIPRWQLRSAFETVLAFVPKELRNKVERVIEDGYEHDHERQVALWMRVLGTL